MKNVFFSHKGNGESSSVGMINILLTMMFLKRIMEIMIHFSDVFFLQFKIYGQLDEWIGEGMICFQQLKGEIWWLSHLHFVVS